MKKILNVILLIVLTASLLSAQTDRSRKIFVAGFYNLENLFDTYDDPAKNDAEFLPDGANQWTEVKYQKKLHNMATVIKSMAQTNGRFHTLLGVSEVENRLVLEDLVSQPEIAAANYQIVHYDGPDMRGVDVALLYRPDNFEFIDSESIPFDFNSSRIEFAMDGPDRVNFKTRDILMVHGLLDGEEFAVYVAHLPSRIGGKGWDLRSRGAEIIYEHACMMMEKHPGIKIIVMGDMNDNPTDRSMTEFMHSLYRIVLPRIGGEKNRIITTYIAAVLKPFDQTHFRIFFQEAIRIQAGLLTLRPCIRNRIRAQGCEPGQQCGRYRPGIPMHIHIPEKAGNHNKVQQQTQHQKIGKSFHIFYLWPFSFLMVGSVA